DSRLIIKAVTALPWGLVVLAATVSALTLFSRWAVNAHSLGKHEFGTAMFFSFVAAYSSIACLWLVPVSIVATVGIALYKSSFSWPCLAAAMLAAIPFLIFR
ncbi:MAG: hypothetical protein M0Z99_35215, partial [Betaproteobacteria bacterium]|nr:hypothetical protein [Betaproteobacteria bacterium]